MEIGKSKQHIEMCIDPTTFYWMGDIHEGNSNCAEKELKQSVEMIAQDKQCRGVFLMGDLIDCIIGSHDPRFNPIEIAEKYKIRDLKDLPRKQAENLFKILRPIEDKILSCIIGNHEEQYIKRHSFDVYDHYCNLFSSKPVKLGYVGFYRLLFKRKNSKQRYKLDIAMNHGVGGGGYREGYPLNKIHDAFRWTRADVNIMGHLHQLVEDQKTFKQIGGNMKLQQRKVLYGMQGCFLRTTIEGNTNYFEHKGRPESDIGMLRMDVYKQGRDHGLKYELKKIRFD